MGKKSTASRDMHVVGKLGGRRPKPTQCPRCGKMIESAVLARKHCRKPRVEPRVEPRVKPEITAEKF
jgi:hypothetical protein